MVTRAAWSPYPLADALLAEYDPHPLLLLAAWTCKYRDDCEALTDLAYRAADRRSDEAELDYAEMLA